MRYNAIHGNQRADTFLQPSKLLMDKDLISGLLDGDIRTLARVITQVENRSPDSLEILQQLFPNSGQSRILGVTGSPGAGKSSLVDRLALVCRGRDERVGIVAVDPSSPFTGGAILGDRIRMQTLGVDPGIYIRSMATRGNLGGLAATTADVVTVMDAAGRDPIIVETVGVGQDEVEIVKLADVSVVVLVPGMGDDIQAIKAGIMEIGDIFVINKSDRPGAEKMESAITAMLSLAHRADDWNPPIVKTVATQGEGVAELVERIDECRQFFEASNIRSQKKRAAARQRLLTQLQVRLVSAALDDVFADGELDRIIAEIAERKQDPYSIVEKIIANAKFGKL
jgi:LAO/AO transport system kinase